jgi:hypothetical protein
VSSHNQERRLLPVKKERSISHPSSRLRSLTTHIIELGPPRKAAPPNEILEQERYHKPRRVVDTSRRWDPLYTVEDNRDIYELEPCLGEASLPEPERHWQNRTNDECVQLWVIDRMSAELTLRSDKSPSEPIHQQTFIANGDTRQTRRVRKNKKLTRWQKP